MVYLCCFFFFLFFVTSWHSSSGRSGDGCDGSNSCTFDMIMHMIPQIGLLAESPITDVTPEGPVTIVDVCVSFEITGCREGFATQAALMRLVLVVSHSVVVQIG
jgi:hypothetical protein